MRTDRLRSWLILLLCLIGAWATTPAVAQITIALTPSTTSVPVTRTQQFTATVQGTANTGVLWKINGVSGGNTTTGTISASGLFTAPNAIPAGGKMTVKAVSKADSTKSATGTVTVTPASKSFYVATHGSDANPGTITEPWRTVQHAANSIGPGSTVSIRAGVYSEQVKITKSGTAAGGYITFRSYPGEAVAIDGTGLTVSGQSGLIDMFNPSYVVIAGLEVRNFKSASSSIVPIGVFIHGAGSHVQLIGNHVHNIVTTVKTSDGNALGIAVYGTNGTTPISNLVISGNEVDHLITGQSESLTINGNVNGFQVTNNKVHDNNNIGIDAIGFEGTSPNAATDQARNGLIAGNTVYHITSATNPAYGDQLGADGIYVDGGADIVIERNLVHHTDLGIELASEHSGKVTSFVTARSNIVYNSYMVGISIGGYAATVGGTSHCTLINNTLFHNDINDTGSGEFQIQYHATDNIFENNIVCASDQGIYVNDFTANSTAPAALNYNLWYGPSDGTWLWNNHSYTGLADFRSSTGNDIDSKFANPEFTNATDFDFPLSAGSSAISAGKNLGSAVEGSLDFAGNPRIQGTGIDIGAYER